MGKISITPIGTCRISTPLKRGAVRFPIKLDYQRIYGFVHTSTEVIQQLRYRRGELSFPTEAHAILFRPGIAIDERPPQDRLADLTIVEISSSKVYMLGDIAIQCNYLHQYFADFFAQRPRVRTYLDLTSKGDPEALQTFLDRHPAYKLYSPEDRKILSSLRTRSQSFEEVSADMAQIAEMIGKDRLLFVTHVNVTTADGSLIPSRDKLIRWVKLAAGEMGVDCFDPTQIMLEFGQERAMEADGLDSTHFTNAFSDNWFATVQRDYLLPRAVGAGIDASDVASSGNSMLAESIAATLQHYDFFEGTRQLFAALKAQPDDASLQMLHGQVLARLGDYESARQVLSPHVGAVDLSHEMRQAMMHVLIETGDAEGALELASQMIGDEYEKAEIYEIAGRAADELNRPEAAVRYRKLAFRLDPTTRGAATSVLEHYKSAGETELYETWLREVLDALDSRGDAALAVGLAEWAMQRREEDALARALLVVANKDPGLFPALVEEATRVEMASPLTSIAAPLMASPALPDKVTRTLRALAQTWAELAQQALADGRTRDAHGLAIASLAVQPNQAIARTVRRAVADALWSDVHAAATDAEVVELCEAAGDTIYGQRSIPLMYARALANVGRVEDAEDIARKMHISAPDDVDASANYARLAALNGDFLVALRIYGSLSHLNPETTQRYQNRIQAFMSRAGPKGVRHVRSLAGEDRYTEALATYRLLEKYGSLPEKQFAAEGARLLSSLRIHLRQLDEDEAPASEIIEVLSLMLELAPDDPRLLRRAGIEYMKVEDFERAMEFWRRLESIAPDLQSAVNNIQRCEILAARQARRNRVRPVAVSLAA